MGREGSWPFGDPEGLGDLVFGRDAEGAGIGRGVGVEGDGDPRGVGRRVFVAEFRAVVLAAFAGVAGGEGGIRVEADVEVGPGRGVGSDGHAGAHGAEVVPAPADVHPEAVEVAFGHDGAGGARGGVPGVAPEGVAVGGGGGGRRERGRLRVQGEGAVRGFVPGGLDLLRVAGGRGGDGDDGAGAVGGGALADVAGGAGEFAVADDGGGGGVAELGPGGAEVEEAGRGHAELFRERGAADAQVAGDRARAAGQEEVPAQLDQHGQQDRRRGHGEPESGAVLRGAAEPADEKEHDREQVREEGRQRPGEPAHGYRREGGRHAQGGRAVGRVEGVLHGKHGEGDVDVARRSLPGGAQELGVAGDAGDVDGAVRRAFQIDGHGGQQEAAERGETFIGEDGRLGVRGERQRGYFGEEVRRRKDIEGYRGALFR